MLRRPRPPSEADHEGPVELGQEESSLENAVLHLCGKGELQRAVGAESILPQPAGGRVGGVHAHLEHAAGLEEKQRTRVRPLSRQRQGRRVHWSACRRDPGEPWRLGRTRPILIRAYPWVVIAQDGSIHI